MEDKQKTQLFESMPVPNAVITLAIPTVLSSLVITAMGTGILSNRRDF